MRAVCYHKEAPEPIKISWGAGVLFSLKAVGGMQISSRQEAENGGGVSRKKTHNSKGVLTPVEIKAREELYRRWKDRKPEISLKNSLSLM